VIEVDRLTKRYGNLKAVDEVSFQVEKGEILGFLGPNGAGKTTTMRILTCFLPATEGTARVAGYDVFEHAMEVKRRIGYLHELPDQLATLSTLTRGSERIMTPEAAPDAVNAAFRQMLGGRQGPVSPEMKTSRRDSKAGSVSKVSVPARFTARPPDI